MEVDPVQLRSPLGGPELSTVVEGRQPVELRLEVAGTWLRASVRRPGASFAVELEVGATPWLRVPGGRASWSMTRATPTRFAGRLSPFARLGVVAREWLDGQRPRAIRPPDNAPDRHDEVATFCTQAARQALELCDQRVLCIARAFTPRIRWFVYAAMVGDRTGRIRQLADSCPGLLTFAYALAEHRVGLDPRTGTDARDRLLRDVIDGRPLRQLLDDVLASWSAEAPYVAGPRGRRCMTALRHASVAQLEHARWAQRHLIRRAVAEVPPGSLWRPPPPGFTLDDVPRHGAAAVERWFRWATDPALYSDEPCPTDAEVALARFVSANVEELDTVARLSRGGGSVPSQLARFVAETGEVIARDAGPSRLLGELGLVAANAATAPANRADVVVAPPPFAYLRDRGVQLRGLRHQREFEMMGRQMRNCLASLGPDAASGRSAFYVGLVGRHRVAVELRRRRDGSWHLRAARGDANRELGPGEWARVRACVERANLDGGRGAAVPTALADTELLVLDPRCGSGQLVLREWLRYCASPRRGRGEDDD